MDAGKNLAKDWRKCNGGPALYVAHETQWSVNDDPITLGVLRIQIDEIQDTLMGALEVLKGFRKVAEGDYQPPLTVIGSAILYALDLLGEIDPATDIDGQEFEVKFQDDGTEIYQVKPKASKASK